MPAPFRHLLAAAALLAAPLPAQAQQIEAGNFFVEGSRFHCGDNDTWITDERLGDLASIDENTRIAIDWPEFTVLPLAVKSFVYYQTCGLLVFIDDPAGADGFAVQVGTQQGWFEPALVEQICNSDLLAASDWSQKPDAARCETLAAAAAAAT